MTVLPQFHDGLQEAAGRLAERRWRRRRRLRIGTFTVTAAVVVAGSATAATGLWSPSLGDDHRGHPTAAADQPPAAQLARLGVLRREQTDADRGAASRSVLRLQDAQFQGIRTGSVRLLDGGPDDPDSIVLLSAQHGPNGASDVLCVEALDAAGTSGSCWTTRQLLSGSASVLRTETAGPPGPNGTRGQFLGLVPDGVTTVRLTEGDVTTDADVHDNFYKTSLMPVTTTPVQRWLDAQGRVVGPDGG